MNHCSFEPSGDWLEDGLIEEVEWLLLVSDLDGCFEVWHLHWLSLWNDLEGSRVMSFWWSKDLAHEITERVRVFLWSEHRSEQVTNWVEFLVVGMSLSWLSRLFDLLLVMWVVFWQEHGLEGLLNISEESINSLEEINEVWESQTEFLQFGHMMVLLELLMELLMEHTSLDVLGLDRLIPLGINTVDLGEDLSTINGESVNLVHEFFIGVARVILHEELEEIEASSHNLEHVIEESILESLEISALSWVLEAEVLHIVTNFLEFANIIELVDITNQFV